MSKDKKYQNIKIETLPNSRVKIVGEITVENFEQARKIALEHIKITAEIPGFRVGKAPDAIVVKHVGGMKILERAAESAINDVYADILSEHDIRAIGMPTVSITKIAPGNPLGFTIETAVMPEISLKNYKSLAKEALVKIPDVVTDIQEKEIDAVIEDLRKRLGDNDGKELPEVNMDFIKKFGNFKDVQAFREKTKEGLIEHKKVENKEKRRGAIAEALITEAKFEVPELIVTSELDTMMNQFKSDIEKNGLTFNNYLASIKKKEDDIRKEWRESAERRARLELILKHIAREEKISPAEEEVKKEVDNIISIHKTADRFSARMYVENMMKNKMVLEFLEKQ